MARRSDGSPFGISYGYLEQTATPGGTMRTQGPGTALGRLHPTFAQRLEAAIREARAEGIEAGVYSAYRPVELGVGGFSNKYNSLHTYGAAVDVTGIGRPGSRTSRRWYEIATKHGLHNPYGPSHGAEWNHYQLVPDKVAPQSWRQFVDEKGPVDQEAMWQAVMPYQSGPSPDHVRMAQEYLRDNGISVPVSGQLDEATLAGLKTWNASPGGAAFAERYGLQRPSEAPQMGFAPERQRTPAQAAINDAMLDARPDRSQPGAYRVDAQPYRGAAPGTDPSTLMQPMAGRPLPVMQIAQAEPPTLPAFQPRKPGEIDPGRFADAFGTPSVLPPGQPDPARFDDAFGTRPPTTAPMMASPGGVPLAPASPYAANYSDKATGLPPLPLTWPGGADYPRKGYQPARSVNDLLAGLPPSATTVLPDPVTELDTIVIPGSGGAPALPRPNPLPPSQRGRSGRTPNGYQWQQIPQKGGPTLLRVTPPNNRRPWTEVLGPAGGAGLFNEFASSFTPVRYR